MCLPEARPWLKANGNRRSSLSLSVSCPQAQSTLLSLLPTLPSPPFLVRVLASIIRIIIIRRYILRSKRALPCQVSGFRWGIRHYKRYGFTWPRRFSVTFNKRSLMNSDGRAVVCVSRVCFTSSPTPPCSFF